MANYSMSMPRSRIGLKVKKRSVASVVADEETADINRPLTAAVIKLYILCFLCGIIFGIAFHKSKGVCIDILCIPTVNTKINN